LHAANELNANEVKVMQRTTRRENPLQATRFPQPSSIRSRPFVIFSRLGMRSIFAQRGFRK
jgi:hypothetical protein